MAAYHKTLGVLGAHSQQQLLAVPSVACLVPSRQSAWKARTCRQSLRPAADVSAFFSVFRLQQQLLVVANSRLIVGLIIANSSSHSFILCVTLSFIFVFMLFFLYLFSFAFFFVHCFSFLLRLLVIVHAAVHHDLFSYPFVCLNLYYHSQYLLYAYRCMVWSTQKPCLKYLGAQATPWAARLALH